MIELFLRLNFSQSEMSCEKVLQEHTIFSQLHADIGDPGLRLGLPFGENASRPCTNIKLNSHRHEHQLFCDGAAYSE
jgi:hypothetical protein